MNCGLHSIFYYVLPIVVMTFQLHFIDADLFIGFVLQSNIVIVLIFYICRIARKGRKKPNRNQTRNSKNTPYYKGFYLNDKVSVFGKSGYITGFTSNAAYIKDENNDYITLPNKTYKQVSINKMKLECHNNNWQYIIKNAV